jgi:hypothetical protein
MRRDKGGGIVGKKIDTAVVGDNYEDEGRARSKWVAGGNSPDWTRPGLEL